MCVSMRLCVRLCVCVRVCVYVCACARARVRACVRAYDCMYVCVCLRARARSYISMGMYLLTSGYEPVHVRVYVCVCVCARAPVCILHVCTLSRASSYERAVVTHTYYITADACAQAS